jgi:hypothetical protein
MTRCTTMRHRFGGGPRLIARPRVIARPMMSRE